MPRTTKVQETRTTRKTDICCGSLVEDFSMDDAVIHLSQKANVLCYKDKNNESSLNTKTNSHMKGWKGNSKRLFSNAEVSINGWKTIFPFAGVPLDYWPWK